MIKRLFKRRKAKQGLSNRNEQRARSSTYIDGLGRGDANRVTIPTFFRQRDPIPKWERVELIDMGRYLYSNDGIVKGAIDDLARYSFPLVPQAKTASSEWNIKAEAYFNQWAQSADIKGRLHFYDLQRLASICLDRDGDIGVMHVNTDEGLKLQLIEADIIRDAPNNTGDWDQGIKYDKYGRPSYYSILDDPEDEQSYRSVPASQMCLLFDPERADQQRGISSISHAVAHIRDKKEILAYEKLGVKNLSSFSAVLHSEFDEPDEDAFGLNEIDGIDAQGSPTEITVSQMQSGEVPILRKGETLTAFQGNRPSSTFQGFLEFLVREFAVGIGLPYEFVWNTQSLTGPSQRFVMGKAQRKFEERQRLFYKLVNRTWAMVIAEGVASGELQAIDGWEKCKIQCPAKLTIDVGRESQQEREDVSAGLMSRAHHFGQRGMDWQNEINQQAKEFGYIMEKSKELAEAYDLPIDVALNRLGGQITGKQEPLIDTTEENEI
jgi:capsid protein